MLLKEEAVFMVPVRAAVLARISLDESRRLDRAKFMMVLNRVITLFREDRKFLETRSHKQGQGEGVVGLTRVFIVRVCECSGSLIIRQLSVLLNGDSIYLALAEILQNEVTITLTPVSATSSLPSHHHLIMNVQDPEFASLMVQTLNLILLTAAELFQLRRYSSKSSIFGRGGREACVCKSFPRSSQLLCCWCAAR